MVFRLIFEKQFHIKASWIFDICSLELPERGEIFTISRKSFGGIRHHISRDYCYSACFRNSLCLLRLFEWIFIQE